MALESVEIQRPDRWSHPLDAAMTDVAVAELLAQPPFSEMDRERFARNTPLDDVLRNDSRILQLEAGDLVFREGQYGGTAYLVLQGDVRIFLSRLLPGDRQQRSSAWSGQNWLSFFSKRRRKGNTHRRGGQDTRRQPRRAETTQPARPAEIGYRGSGTETRVFLQDVPGVLADHSTTSVSAGELFGEMAAVTRSPREFTAVAETRCTVLEIRWQGLKLLKQDPAFRAILDERYRRDVLQTHLHETKQFRFVPESHLEAVVESAKLESFGNMEWYAEYRKQSGKQAREKISAEPLIAEEGSYATGVWILRGGFARLSRRQGAGHRTLAYLGKGHVFGMEELAHNLLFAQGTAPLPYQESLRAIGYVDALFIPKQVVNEHILPFVRSTDLPQKIESPRYQFGAPVIDAPLDIGEQSVETGLLEYLVDLRLMNGLKAMVIDTDRCTRCDDCVKACANTHGGTPVFEREGPQYGKWMFAQACMHCANRSHSPG